MQTHSEVLKQIGTLAARGLSRGELTKQQRIDILRDIERLANAPIAAPALDDEMRAELKAMSEVCGWAEIGGRIIRDPVTNEVTSRTKWIPHAEWWPGRPKGLNEKESRAAINKALADEPLRPAEKRLIDYMVDYVREVQHAE